LGILENVKKVNSHAKERVKKESTKKATGKREKGKCKGTSSMDYRIPKRGSRKAAHCARNMGACT